MARSDREFPLVVEIALAGGPCAGKTASLPLIKQALREKGWRLLILPEIATMFYSGGIDDVGYLADQRREVYARMQQTFAAAQLALRDQYRRLAASFAEPAIVINDRTELDLSVYLTEAETEAAFAACQTTREQLLDSYDAVIYLRSGAGTVDQLENNVFRRESDVAAAHDACARTLAVYQGHPRLTVIEQNPSFVAKVQQTIDEIDAAARAVLQLR